MRTNRPTNNARDGHCPPPDDLLALLEGSLDEPVEHSVSLHLETCPTCRRALEETAADRSWWDEVETFLAPWPMARASDKRAACFTETQAGQGQAGHDIAAEIRQWLGPTDDPQALGRIGRYEVTGVVGAGSMGVVLKALEPQLKRFVAIKVLLPLLAHNGAARHRFSREARSAAAVNHPHVVPIYGVDEYQGLPYLVMQYVPGESLAERIARDGPLSAEEVVRIALQTARALAAAHEQGLVHRDIKPANILLENGIERALVTDFGLARIADDASMTGSGVITGTPQFMSPEQASGHGIDARSDLFSLGAVMYAMCTGHPPFRAETVFGLLKRICEDTPRPVRASNPEIPDWLDQLIGKLLAKAPADRFASADEVAEHLAAELAHLQNPLGTRPPARPWLVRPRLLERVRSRHWLGLTAALVLAAGGWYALQADPPAKDSAMNATQVQVRVQAGDTETAWFGADGRQRSLSEEVARLESRFWSYPESPVVDPWAAELQSLDDAIGRLEVEYGVPAF